MGQSKCKCGKCGYENAGINRKSGKCRMENAEINRRTENVEKTSRVIKL